MEQKSPAVVAPVEPTVRPEPAAYMVTVPVDVGVGMDHDTLLRWEPGLPDEGSEPLYDIAAVRELAAVELERVAAEAPVNGNHLATERVLMAAQRLRGPNARVQPTAYGSGWNEVLGPNVPKRE